MSLDTRTQHYQALLPVLLCLFFFFFNLFPSTPSLCLWVGGLSLLPQLLV